MSDFELAVAKTILNEGGDKYTDLSDDHGGPTKYGISLRFLLEVYNTPDELKKAKGTMIERLFYEIPTKATIQYLREDNAKYIYYRYFWLANRYGEIEDQEIAEKVFDMAVLMGAPFINEMVQRVLTKHGGNLKFDGIFGTKTLNSINRITFGDFTDSLIILLTSRMVNICNKDSTQDGNLKGWLNRVMS